MLTPEVLMYITSGRMPKIRELGMALNFRDWVSASAASPRSVVFPPVLVASPRSGGFPPFCCLPPVLLASPALLFAPFRRAQHSSRDRD